MFDFTIFISNWGLVIMLGKIVQDSVPINQPGHVLEAWSVFWSQVISETDKVRSLLVLLTFDNLC